MKNILVTGGAGFIGSHLCNSLINRGYHVFCLDNLSSGHLKNIESLLPLPQFTFIQADVINQLDLAIDEIYHLASPASPKLYQQRPVDTNKTIVLGSINMLELALKYKAKILLASTSEIYGDPLVHPQPESYPGNVNVTGPRSCYNESKRCAETFFYDYRRQYGLDTKVARIFNTYGPHMHATDGRVVSSFITQAIANKDITIFGDGFQTRSFCYVDDMVMGLVKLMETKDGPTAAVNLGNDSEITILELASTIVTLTNSCSKIVNYPLPEDDPRQRCPDLTLARKHLEWNPSFDLIKGLKQYIAYFQKQQ